MKSKPKDSSSAEKAYLRNLREDLEIEEEFASIFGRRKQATVSTDTYSDEPFGGLNMKIHFSCQEDYSIEPLQTRSFSALLQRDEQEEMRLRNMQNFHTVETRFNTMVGGSNNLRQPKPIRGSIYS